MSHTKVTKEMIAEAIKGSGGIISVIAKRLHISWGGCNNKIQQDPKLKRLLIDEMETILDLAESTIFNNIKNGDSHDAKWLLRFKGKHRGYNDNEHVEVVDQSPLRIEFPKPTTKRDYADDNIEVNIPVPTIEETKMNEAETKE